MLSPQTLIKPYKRIFVEITNDCNLHCTFCHASSRKKTYMSRPLFDKILQEARPLTDEFVFHILGEPLLHPELEYFIDQTITAGMTVMMTTNGTLLSEKTGEMLAHKKIRQVNISLHTHTGTVDDGYLEKVLQFTDMSQRSDPDGYINLRIWDLPASDNTAIVDRINEHYGTHVVLNKEGSSSNIRKSYPVTGRIYIHRDTQFTWPDMSRPILQEQGTCYGTRSHIGILSDGTVIPCCLDSNGVINLGNVHNEDLCVIINKPRVHTIRAGFDKGTIEEELCKRCGYIERFSNKGLS